MSGQFLHVGAMGKVPEYAHPYRDLLLTGAIQFTQLFKRFWLPINLIHPKNYKLFISFLKVNALLTKPFADGHDIGAPWDEALALREAIQRADQAMEKSIHGLWAARFAAASTAGNAGN